MTQRCYMWMDPLCSWCGVLHPVHGCHPGPTHPDLAIILVRGAAAPGSAVEPMDCGERRPPWPEHWEADRIASWASPF